MADSDQSKPAPTLTARDQEVAIQALLNLKSGEDLQVDNVALASALGLKNAASAATCWCNLKKKLLAIKNSSANTSEPGAVSVITTKAKAPRAKSAPKSKKSAISEAAVEQSSDPGDNDHAEGTSPGEVEPPATTTSQATPAATKKRGRKTKAEKEAEASAALAAAALAIAGDGASGPQVPDDDNEAEEQPPAKKQRKAPMKKPVPQPDAETIKVEDVNASVNASACSAAKPRAARKPRKAPTKKVTVSEVIILDNDNDNSNGEAASPQATPTTTPGIEIAESEEEGEITSLDTQTMIPGQTLYISEHSVPVTTEDLAAPSKGMDKISVLCVDTSDPDTIVVN